MLRKENKKAQAAVEFAVFGAVLIFLLGTIVRSAVGNSYTQNQNFKAMRMAMLASWTGSEAGNTAHNSASVLFVEDRLSPDFNKYGDLDRNPFVANGSGVFSYELLYPLNVGEVATMLPIMDVYINGQHFPFTTAAYVSGRTVFRPGSGSPPCAPGEGPYPPPTSGSLLPWQCAQNQCLRNAREWVGGTVTESEFANIIPVTAGAGASAQMAQNASTIFTDMLNVGLIANVTGTDLTKGGDGLTGDVTSLVTTSGFNILSYASAFTGLTSAQLDQIQSILQSNATQYKLFYSMVANGEEEQFSPTPPVCVNINTLACKDKALSSTVAMQYTTCAPGSVNSAGLCVNNNGDMEYDLLRNGNYYNPSDTTAVETQFPTVGSCAVASMRCNIAWQWSATAATSASQIGLVTSSNTNYPSYDIDGRLKPVTIYSFSQNSDGTPLVSYEDFQGGDIDSTWDTNSCGPKPGLQNNAQIFTFTSPNPGTQGSWTYLQILEGKLYNPETNEFVRSANKRDNIDLIQREFQLSNNTGRFCNGNAPLSTVANDGVTPNPVEACITPGGSCFTGSNSSGQIITQTCLDESDNMLFIRSRIQDLRGSFWMTNTSGQLQVQ
jgi:hypothetical protein